MTVVCLHTAISAKRSVWLLWRMGTGVQFGFYVDGEEDNIVFGFYNCVLRVKLLRRYCSSTPPARAWLPRLPTACSVSRFLQRIKYVEEIGVMCLSQISQKLFFLLSSRLVIDILHVQYMYVYNVHVYIYILLVVYNIHV